MPAAMKMSSHPSALRSSTLGPQVAVENARFGAVGVKVAEERVVQRDIVAAPPPGVAGEHTDIGHEQIEQAVAVIIKKYRAGRVAHVSHSRLRGDVAKRPMP